MNIDLNGKEFEGTAIFNGGNAGLAKDVSIFVNKRKVDEPENYPDYKLIIKDSSGAELSQGFYYFTPNAQKDEAYNDKRATQEVSRVLHLTRAVMGSDYTFPAEVASVKEAYDLLFKLVNENVEGKTFNVFVTYGTTMRPSKYLGVRYFDYIEPAGGVSRLRVKRTDSMERVVADVPTMQISSNSELPQSPGGSKTEDWI
jgi:hypothetical protein|tara:strand:+ start:3228 stop:3827 length:600 start_codon:yes stop_codon:yes gene_type:complete